MPITERMMKRREKAKELREQGLTYKEISEEIGVSETMARHYCTGKKRVTEKVKKCRLKGRNGLMCQRHVGHHGVHLNDEAGLIYWE